MEYFKNFHHLPFLNKEPHCDKNANEKEQHDIVQKFFTRTIKLRNSLKKDFWNRKVSHSNVRNYFKLKNII